MNSKIKGLYYYENVVSEENEQKILMYLIDHNDEASTALKRVVHQYGYTYDYKARKISVEPTLKIPDCMKNLLESLRLPESFDGKLFDPESLEFDQCICNRYMSGEGISAHIDNPIFGDVIVCFTLQSGCTIEFMNSVSGEKENLYVKPRSVYIMSGQARNNWTHCIQPRKTDRVDGDMVYRGIRWSITFRKVK